MVSTALRIARKYSDKEITEMEFRVFSRLVIKLKNNQPIQSYTKLRGILLELTPFGRGHKVISQRAKLVLRSKYKIGIVYTKHIQLDSRDKST